MSDEKLIAQINAAMEYQKIIAAKDKRITQLEEAVIASESAFLTQVGCDYNDVIHAAYMKCKEAIKK